MKDLSNMDIKNYWQVIKGRKYLFIFASMAIMSVIVWGSFFMPKIYQAKSTVFIERNIVKNLVQGMVITPPLEHRLKVLTHTMHSRDMLMKVIRALDLDVQADSPGAIETLINDFRRNTDIGIKGRDLFKVSYKGKDPKMVRDYVNTLISIYLEENISVKREQTTSATHFLTDQIANYKKRLEEADDKVSRYRLENNLYFTKDEASIVTDIKNTSELLEKTKLALKEYAAKKKKIEAQLSGEEPLALAIVDNEEAEKNDFTIRLKNLEKSLPMLLTRYTENYPEVIRVKAEIETLKKQIEADSQSDLMADTFDDDMTGGTSIMNPVYQMLKENRLKVESEMDSLMAKESMLRERLKTLEENLKNMPEDQKALAGMLRERNSYRRIYENLLSRLGQAEVSEQMELEDKGTTFRIVDPAVLPIKPVSPDRVKYILIGIIAGLAGGIGVLLILEYFDHSIKDVDTLRSSFNLPVFAVIPQIITEQDIAKNKRMDKTVYAISIIYISIIGGLFLKEIADKFL
jgi:polysaccharide chain length determinant protein (PEP-CTERM system associated)